MFFVTKKGFTVVEVLISMAIFGIVMASLPAAFLSHLRINERMSIKTGAMAAGQVVMDNYRSVDPTSLPEQGEGAAQTISVNGRQYTVQATFCENAEHCISNNNRHIKLRIFYEEEEVSKLETVFTRLK